MVVRLAWAVGMFAVACAAQADLVSTGAVWRYLDDGSNQGTAWRSPTFDHSTWPTGAAPLGFGEPLIVTTTRTGRVTYYFRQKFVVSDAAAITNLTLHVLRDDGAIVYLNGTNVFRNNLAQNPAYTTVASANLEATNYISTNVNRGLLREGTNVLAAEVHNFAASNGDLVFDARLVGITNTGVAGLVRGPYLMSCSTTSIVVRWRSETTSNSRVRYGLSPTSLDQIVTITGTRTNHEVRLIGLSPDTKYFYSVGSSTATLASGSEYYFVTSPRAAKPTRIWVIGDSGTATANARSVYDQYRTYAGTRYTDLWLMLGDNAYTAGTDAEYQRAMFDMYTDLLRKTVVWPAIGNHDTSQNYFDIVTLPTAGEAGGVPSGTKHYFSFDYGNIHFVCLDSMFSSRLDTGPMCGWLREDLAANTNEWLIAFWHHPPYSKGSHDSDVESELIEMRENVVPILESYGVDLVLCGHSHGYERSFLLRGHYGNSSTLKTSMIRDAGDGREDSNGAYMKRTDADGTVYVVAGSSGQITSGPLDHPAMFVSYLRMGSLVLDLDGSTLRAHFLRETGAIDDHFSIFKDSSSDIRFTRYQFANGKMALVWKSNPGHHYDVQYTAQLSPVSWAAVSGQLLATNSATTFTHSPQTTKGFYRIRQLD
ncbi:MAG TPA: metallophosphoesterase family protein [Candidatus Binatia bacterium]|nr:metallophosphoesterase family protein [Candidatus Binatia bacterium]